MLNKLPLWLLLLASPVGAAIDFPVVYSRVPLPAAGKFAQLTEVRDPGQIEPGADLVLHRPDGTEAVLVNCPDSGTGACSALDFNTLDGVTGCYSLIHRPGERDSNVNNRVPLFGASLMWIDTSTGATRELLPPEYDIAHPSEPAPRYKALNLGCQMLPGGKLLFTSNRDGHIPVGGGTFPNMTIWAMHDALSDHPELEHVVPMSLCSALHPTLLNDGRIAFSSCEDQGFRDERNWAIWVINPDGRQFGPLWSGFRGPLASHFQAQLSDGRVVFIEYYNLNKFGAGLPIAIPYPLQSPVSFYSAAGAPGGRPTQTQAGGAGCIRKTQNNIGLYGFTMPFATRGAEALASWTHGEDNAAPCPPPYPNQGTCDPAARVGTLTTPHGAPGNRLLMSHSFGPVNTQRRPINEPGPNFRVCLTPAGGKTSSPAELECFDNPGANDMQPVPLVSYRAIYGRDPVDLPWLPHQPPLPPGSPYGIVGTGDIHKREAEALMPKSANIKWAQQGSEAGGEWTEDDVTILRLVGLEPNLNSERNQAKLRHAVRERHRVQGEWEADEMGRAAGFAVGDSPWTLDVVQANGCTRAHAQTWHQVRPGEIRTDCGGCHAHSNPDPAPPLSIEFLAAQVYGPQPSVTVGFEDVWPIIQRIPEFAAMTEEQAYVALAESGNSAGFKNEHGQNALSLYVKGYESNDSQLMAMLTPETTDAERRQIALWIDLAAPRGGAQWRRDTQPPTLVLDQPKRGENDSLPAFRIGAADANSGLKGDGVASVKATIAVRGRPPMTELADLATVADLGIWEIDLVDEECPPPGGCAQRSPEIDGDAIIYVTVEDNGGNRTRLNAGRGRKFSLKKPTPTPTSTFTPTPTATPTATPTPTRTCAEVMAGAEAVGARGLVEEALRVCRP